MRVKLVLCTLFLLQGLCAQKLSGLLWRVHSPEGKVSHLFGTYHLLGADYLTKFQTVDSVYRHSSSLVVEAIIDPVQDFGLMMRYTTMSEKSLHDLLDSIEFALVNKKIGPLLGPGSSLMLPKMSPIFLTTTYVAKIATEETPADFSFEGLPIDIHLASHAAKTKKKRIALETLAEQMELLFYSQSLQEQARDLMWMLVEEDSARQAFRAVVESYRKQDLETMAEMDQSLSPEANAKLLVERNQKWLPKLEPLLREGEVFVAVGAMHLPGELGLLELLREKGFRLEPVPY